MLTVIMALFGVLLFSPIQSPSPETCEAIHNLIGGELVEWLDDGNGYGYWDLPDDLTKVGRIDFANGGIWARHSDSQQARYIVVFVSYDQTTDSQGNHLGAHEFCGPFKVQDGT